MMIEKRMLVEEKAWWSWITETSFFLKKICFFFFLFVVTFARLHAVFGHGGGNDLVFCGLKTFVAHFWSGLLVHATFLVSCKFWCSCSTSMFIHVTPRVNSKANWRKVSPFALFLLCQSSYCVHDHPSVSDLCNITICQKEDVGENNTTFSVIERTKEELGILRKVYLTIWVEFGVAAGLAHGGQPASNSANHL